MHCSSRVCKLFILQSSLKPQGQYVPNSIQDGHCYKNGPKQHCLKPEPAQILTEDIIMCSRMFTYKN
jgi:hypothetical protein